MTDKIRVGLGVNEMGNLSKMHRMHKFSHPKIGAKIYPLRKIIGFNNVKEVLECGHEIYPPMDFIGYYSAQKRRCKYCYENKKSNGR